VQSKDNNRGTIEYYGLILRTTQALNWWTWFFYAQMYWEIKATKTIFTLCEKPINTLRAFIYKRKIFNGNSDHQAKPKV